MEKRVVDSQILFKNYLRSLFVQLEPARIPKLKAVVSKILEPTWCSVISDPVFTRELLSYYLVSRGCPEFRDYTTSDLVQERFNTEDLHAIKSVAKLDCILILRHSSDFIRNKLMMETSLNVVAERVQQGRPTIVVSDKLLDSGEYVYYDHEQIKKYIPYNVNINRETVSKTAVTDSETSRYREKLLARRIQVIGDKHIL